MIADGGTGKMILQSHPTVNAFVREFAERLDRDGRLSALHTTLNYGRRSLKVPRAKVHLHPWRELVRLAAGRLGLRGLTRHECGWASVDAVYQSLDAAVARQLNIMSARGPRLPEVVYAYEDGALASFRAARDNGVRRVYELPIAYWETSRRLLQEEAERLPAWVPTLGGTQDSEEKLSRKTEEMALAELVICPSQFVQATLPAGVRSIVAEFGSPHSASSGQARSTDSGHGRAGGESGPLRLLFAGAMTQRKGLADVFAAMRLLKRSDVELVVMGAPVVPMEFYRNEFPRFIHHPPCPHAQVLEIMDTCDVLVLPSIVEGRALVQQEALSRGLPLLVTSNAGGEDLVDPGITGWLVPIRDPEQIAKRIAWFADHRTQLSEMRSAALARSEERTWEDYGRKILAGIDALADNSSQMYAHA